ncbi:hypothetical protein [Bacillus alkalicellulosilyticus]|uniref:hypothetical protein n=1 Tax=Alkalihalobacterium alkalicellulosilyticum TaxID=1912214 RepID=UPI0009983EE1|nr:hypothetical protein [Bacillus alkalicellulosilyticus]
MLVNKKRKWKSKVVTLAVAFALITTVGATGAAQVTAHLDGSGTSKNTSTLTASNSTNGNIYVTNTGSNTTTRGYAKREISWWPDSTAASTSWLNPGTTSTVRFSQTSGHQYYGQIVGQTTSSRGAVRLTVN